MEGIVPSVEMSNVTLVRMARAIQKTPNFGYPAGVSIVDLVPEDMKSLVTSFLKHAEDSTSLNILLNLGPYSLEPIPTR